MTSKKPPEVTHLNKYKYDKALRESDKATDAIEPPPVNALHKTISQSRGRRLAAELRLSETPEARTHSRKMDKRREAAVESTRKAMEYRKNDEWYIPPDYEDPTPPPPKPKKQLTTAQQHRIEYDKAFKAMVEKHYREGKFTRKRHWTAEKGWYFIYTSTVEHMQDLKNAGVFA